MVWVWRIPANFAADLKASELKKGERAVIRHLEDSVFTKRLMEMGCVPGTPVFIQFIAAGGEPIAYNIDGYTLGLRLAEAEVIEVERDGEG